MAFAGKPRRVLSERPVIGILVILALFACAKFASFNETEFPIATSDTSVFAKASRVPFPSTAFATGAKGFVTPLIFKAARNDDPLILEIHRILSIVAWASLALVIASLFDGPFTRFVSVTAICAFALTYPISGWDWLLGSESSGISIMILMLAATVLLLHRAGRDLSCWSVVTAWLAIAFLVGGTRDTLNYVLMAIAVLVVARIPFVPRRAPLAIGVAGLVVVIGCHDYFVQNSKRWRAPLLNVALRHILPNPRALEYWKSHYDFPDNESFLEFSGRASFRQPRGSRSIKRMIFKPRGSEVAEFRDVREWFLTRGRTSYMKYLLSHPGESIAIASRKYLRYLGFRGGDVQSVRVSGLNLSLTNVLYPVLDRRFLPAVLLAVVAVCGVALRQSPKHRFPVAVVAAVLVGSWGQMFLAYHGDSHDLGRHSIQYGILLRLGLLMTVFLFVSVVEARLSSGRLATRIGT